MSYPDAVAVAGLVPCAESGMSIIFLGVPSLSICAFLITDMPAYSPCAPAAGTKLVAVSPVILARVSCSTYISSSAH